jgi:hypothetical protein
MNETAAHQAQLAQARELIFSMGLEDSAARLGAANMAYGLAKINAVLSELGYPADASFIATPDLTITRNTARWQAGFGYGGKVQWGDGERPLLVLDVKPNGCGMLVGGLAEPPEAQAVIERLGRLKATRRSLSGIEINWDFGRGNHFIDICRVQAVEGGAGLPPYAFVMHGSCPELHGETALGPGAYWDASLALQREARVFETLWGPLHVLLDEQVAPFVEFWGRADQFAKERRLLAARECFGDFEVIANVTHQGLWGANGILLGCQDTGDGNGGGVRAPALQDGDGNGKRRPHPYPSPSLRSGEGNGERQRPLLPIMVRSDLPGYLFEGLPNLSEAVIDGLGFRERAERHEVLHRLREANVLPHGAGYAIPHLREVLRVIEVGDRRYFEMSTIEAQTTELVEDLHDVQQKYRGRQPVLKALECGLGRMVARLTPMFVLKA